MDFSRIGVVEADGAAYCAHAQRKDGKKNCHIRGPFRPDQQAAQEDLESMRAAASGMGREDGFAAMAAEAKRLIAGKAPKAEGSVEPMGVVFRARIQWRVEGSIIPARGPRRAEKRRAEEDLECMREASSRHEDVLASRRAVDAEVRRLQQQAETEQRVELFAHRLSQQAQQQQPSVGQQRQQQQPSVLARRAASATRAVATGI